ANEVQLGQAGGEENHTLNSNEVAAHTHTAFGTTSGPAAGNPSGNLWATLTATQNPYGQTANARMAPAAIGSTGAREPHESRSPCHDLSFVLCLVVIFPSRSGAKGRAMSSPFLGEIRMVAFNFAPRGWAVCNVQLMQIAQNTALFSLLGTTYGGDG